MLTTATRVVPKRAELSWKDGVGAPVGDAGDDEMFISNAGGLQDTPQLLRAGCLRRHRVLLVDYVTRPVEIGRARNMAPFVFGVRSEIFRLLHALFNQPCSYKSSHVDDPNRGIMGLYPM